MDMGTNDLADLAAAVMLTADFLQRAVEVAENAVRYTTPILHKGCKAVAVKGRKVPINTEVTVFWVGTVVNKFSGVYEERAGVVLPNGDKVWVSAANFSPLPTDEEVKAHLEAVQALAKAKADLQAFEAKLKV